MQKMKLISFISLAVFGLVTSALAHQQVKVNTHYDDDPGKEMTTNAVFNRTTAQEQIQPQAQERKDILVFAPNNRSNISFSLVNGNEYQNNPSKKTLGFKAKDEPYYVLGGVRQGTKVNVYKNGELLATIPMPSAYSRGDTENYVYNNAGVTIRIKATSTQTDNVSLLAMKFDPATTEVPVYMIEVSPHNKGVAGFTKDWSVKNIFRQ